jgi:hypothetical protein
MNHAFSPFLAENQRPKNFQTYPQTAKGINIAINGKMFCGKIPSGAAYNRKRLANSLWPTLTCKTFSIVLCVDAHMDSALYCVATSVKSQFLSVS